MLTPRFFAIALALSTSMRAQPPSPQAPVSVMVVGGVHMANPGHDIHNTTVPDVLLPQNQAEIARITDALAAFHPTEVMAEWPEDRANQNYAQYLSGTLPPSRNEVVQLGFRLAKTAGLSRVYGIDVDGEFPYDAVESFAQAHGQKGLLDRIDAEVGKSMETDTAMLRTQGISATLRHLNEPGRIAHDNSLFYGQMLRVGAGSEQPGADLLTAWYHRNFLICANLIQNTHPGDRIVVFYGAGHAFLLRQCVTQTPGFTLVEPNSFLPR